MKRILLVDDDHVHHVVTGMLLKKLPFKLETQKAMNGKEALDLLLKPDYVKPDLILLDLNMPVMDGWQFLSEIEPVFASYSRKPVIVILSSTIANDDIEKARSFKDVHSFVSKPLLRDKMIELLTRLGFSSDD